MAYINLDPNYFENLKSKRLKLRLGECADTIPLKLWCHAAKHHPKDGIFKNYTANDLAILVGFLKESKEMIEALIEFELLEVTPEGWYKIHQWEDHQGHIISFSERSIKANKVRWGKYKNNRNSNKESKIANKESRKESPIPNHTIPYLTIPNHNQKIKSYVDFEKSTIDIWNSFCDKFPVLSKVMELSDKRRMKLKKRFEAESFRNFESIITAASGQQFLLGDNDRKWKISFDWLIDNDTNYLKVLEKKYQNHDTESDQIKLREKYKL